MPTPAHGISVHSVPTPFAIGRVNCLLVDDDPLTLVDCGPSSGTALVELEQGLARVGRRVEDLERIVLTHQHIDHIGLTQVLAERSGAEVCAHAALAPWLARYDESMEVDDQFAEDVMHRHGVPRDITTALRSVTQQYRAWGSAAEVTRPLADGDVLEFAHRRWTAHHRPGHSPSDTVFLDEERRVLIGGDHLLGHVSSNPLVSRPLEGGTVDDRPQALVAYMDSLRKTREMGLDLIYPGHGEAVTGHVELIDERFRLHDRRARKIERLISEQPRTAYDIAQALWGNVAVTQAYLTISEVLGHVDLLLNEDRVVEAEDEDRPGVVRFSPPALDAAA